MTKFKNLSVNSIETLLEICRTKKARTELAKKWRILIKPYLSG